MEFRVTLPRPLDMSPLHGPVTQSPLQGGHIAYEKEPACLGAAATHTGHQGPLPPLGHCKINPVPLGGVKEPWLEGGGQPAPASRFWIEITQINHRTPRGCGRKGRGVRGSLRLGVFSSPLHSTF